MALFLVNHAEVFQRNVVLAVVAGEKRAPKSKEFNGHYTGVDLELERKILDVYIIRAPRDCGIVGRDCGMVKTPRWWTSVLRRIVGRLCP